MIDQVGRLIVHAPGGAAGAKAPLLAGKRYDPRMLAVIAIGSDKPMLRNPAPEKLFKLIPNENRQRFSARPLLALKDRPIGFNRTVEKPAFRGTALVA